MQANRPLLCQSVQSSSSFEGQKGEADHEPYPKVVQVVMKDPKYIYLSAPVRSGSMICEAVERDSPIDAVLSLIEEQGLTSNIARNCSLVGKRHDGSTIPVALLLKESIQQVEDKLAAALVCPTRAPTR